MKKSHLLFAALLAALPQLHAAPETGTPVWQDTFTNPIDWTQAKGAEFHRDAAGNYLRLDNSFGTYATGNSLTADQGVFGQATESRKHSISVTRDITEALRPYAGCEIELFADVKADKVPFQKIAWEGVRVVLNVTTPANPFGSSINGLSGTFDWKTASFRTRLPSGMTGAKISLGLISEGGTAQIRNLRIAVTDISRAERAEQAKFDGPPCKGHSLPRLRGLNTMRGDRIGDLRNNWKANVLKYTFSVPSPAMTPDEAKAHIDAHLRKIEELVEIMRPTGMLLVVQMHRHKETPDQTEGTNSDLFYLKPEYAKQFAVSWAQTAEYFKTEHDVIWGFELLNESVLRIPQPRPGCPDYEELMEMAAREINRVDPRRTVIVQPEQWWGMAAWEKMRPIQAKNVVYAVHFYSPFRLTHQNLYTVGAPIPYPGELNGVYWDKERLRESMTPALEFQKAYNAHMFVSEFSCIRWAPGSETWIDDAISLFEEYGWDWLFHDIYAWPGWNPELGPDRNDNRPVPGNPRELVLKKWMNNNQFQERRQP